MRIGKVASEMIFVDKTFYRRTADISEKYKLIWA